MINAGMLGVYHQHVSRSLALPEALRRRSCFLFGPRQTGKTSLVHDQLPQARVYDLLDSATFTLLSRSPRTIGEELAAAPTDVVVIDEVQKLPALLDEVHRLIERTDTRFLLTGSSARKLRRAGTNLLGGRARQWHLHPLILREVPDLDLLRALNHGLIPSIYLSDEPDKDLAAYVGLYLREEIAAEGLTRNIPAFSRFLEVAALCNGALINHSKIANDAHVARTTVQEYFAILEDTLVARRVPGWRKGTRRKPLTTDKLYLFDPGVARALSNQGAIKARSPAFGPAFETYLCHELASWIDYTGQTAPLCYWRSTSGFEVDFVVGERIAIEVKATSNPSEADLKGLRALRQEGAHEHFVVACLVERARRVDDIDILPWRELLSGLWDGRFA